MGKKVILQRTPSRDDGTLGNVSVVGTDFTCYSLELSDRGNVSAISCILPGFYICRWLQSPAHGWCWHVLGVSGRSLILIHSANLAGNTEQGYQKQLLGCIALGSGLAIFKAGQSFHVEGPNGPTVEPLGRDQRGIENSVNTIKAFNALMGTEDFSIEILAPKPTGGTDGME